MFWIFLFVVFTLLLVAVLVLHPRYTFTRDRQEMRTLDLRAPAIGVYVVGFILSLIVFCPLSPWERAGVRARARPNSSPQSARGAWTIGRRGMLWRETQVLLAG